MEHTPAKRRKEVMVRHARGAAFIAIASALALALFFALIAYISRPTRTGGMPPTQTELTWFTAGIPIVLLIAVFLAYAKILFDDARYGHRPA